MALTPDLIQTICGPHPARAIPFADLLAGLDAAVAARDVLITRDGDLELYFYSRQCVYESHWNLFTLLSRGLILDRRNQRIIATPFPKFFNYGELIDTLPNLPFEVSEKIDGSLGILFQHAGQWRVTTRGSLSSEQGQWATAFLNRHINVGALTPGTTYLVEIIYPANRIVIQYGFEALILLAAYDQTGRELSRPELETAASATGLRIAPSHAYDHLPQLLEVAKSLCAQEEGFVVRFSNGLRVKIKGEEYCRLHRVIFACTPLGVWEAMSNADNTDAMRRELPEELHHDFDAIRALLEKQLEAILLDITQSLESTANLSDKDLGLLLQSGKTNLSPIAQKFLFSARHRNFLKAVHEPGDLRRRAFTVFRPTRNTLEGYTPSSAMKRFSAEAE